MNANGQYRCICCNSVADILPWLIFANRYYLRELSIDGENYRRIAEGYDNVAALDYDYAEQMLYFSDVKAHKIHRLHLNGSGQETIIKHDIPGGEGLALDWIARLVEMTSNH